MCHTIPPKGEGWKLLISYSVTGTNLPASQLANQNIFQLLIMGHLPTPDLPKRLALYSYDHNFPRGLPYQWSVHSSNGKLFGGWFGAHFYSASSDIRITTNTFSIFFNYVTMTCWEWGKRKYYIRSYNIWVWFGNNCYNIEVLVLCITFPKITNK